MGCEVIALRTTPNGEFPDHAPDPSHAAHLKELRKTIIEQGQILVLPLMVMATVSYCLMKKPIYLLLTVYCHYLHKCVWSSNQTKKLYLM